MKLPSLKLLIHSTVCLTVLFLLSSSPTRAAKLYFQPASIQLSVNQSTIVNLILDTESADVLGSTVEFTYDPSRVKISDIITGNLGIYPVAAIDEAQGKVVIISHVSSPSSRVNGIANIASFTVSGISSSDTSLNINFTPGARNDSNVTGVSNNEAVDILTSTGNASISIINPETGGLINPTATPTSPPADNIPGVFNRLYQNLIGDTPPSNLTSPDFSADGPLPEITPITKIIDTGTIFPSEMNTQPKPVESTPWLYMLVGIILFLLCLILIYIIVKRFHSHRQSPSSPPQPPITPSG